MLLSFAVPTLLPATTFWTDADAATYDELEEKVIQSEVQYKMAKQRDTRSAASVSEEDLPPALQEGINRLKAMQAESEAAAARPAQIAAIVRYTGVALLLVGVLWHYAVGNR